jgi:large repetitive protein
VCDTSTPVACDAATVALTIGSVNDVPAAASDSATLAEDTTLNGSSVLANDSDVHTGAPGENNTPLTAQLAGAPSHAASFTLNPNGTFVYTPTANFFGADSFTYRAVDALGGLSAPTTVTLNVTNVNDNPDAVDDTATVGEDSAANPIAVLANDTIAPDTGETLTISAAGKPGNGSTAIISGGAGLTYTPNAGFLGIDVFTYTIADGNGGSDTAVVTMTVTAVNDPPSFTAGPDQTVLEDSGPQTVNPWATGISPGPPDEAGQTVSFNVTGNTNPGLFSAGPAIAPAGVGDGADRQPAERRG